MTPFPISGHVVTDAQRVYQNGTTLIVVGTDGGLTVYNFDSTSIAAATLTGIKLIQSNPTGLNLVSVLPVPFSFDKNTVTINGAGFLATKTYNLWWEDVIGVQDNNGYSMPCTFVDSYTLIGDGSQFNLGDGSYGYYLYVSDGTNFTNSIITQNPGNGRIVIY